MEVTDYEDRLTTSDIDRKFWDYFDVTVTPASNLTSPYPTRDQTVVIITYWVLLIVGGIGNVAVLIALTTSRRRKSRVDLLMTHLAVADVCVTCGVIPLEIGWKYTNAWLAGNLMCKLLLVLRAFGLYLSSNILVCISVDRFFAVIYPLRLSDARKRSKQMLYSAWVVALACGLPQSVVFRVQHHPYIADFDQCVSFDAFSSYGQEVAYNVFCLCAMYFVPLVVITVCYLCIFCEIRRSSKELDDFDQCVSFDAFSSYGQEVAYNVFCLCAMYFVPLVVITVCYLCIFCEIRRSSKELDEKCEHRNGVGHVRLRRSDKRVLERARQRTLRMTISIVAVFALCWLPYAFMAMWYMVDRKSTVRVAPGVQDMLFAMAVSNSCMNPLVYGSYTLNIRGFIQRFLRKICCGSPDTSDIVGTTGSSTIKNRHLNVEAPLTTPLRDSRVRTRLGVRFAETSLSVMPERLEASRPPRGPA